MKKAEDENRNLSEKELHKAFKLANKPRKTIILNYCINRFLESQKGKSKKVYNSYVNGLDALETYLSNYDGFSTNGKTSSVNISMIIPSTIDYLLSFFIIRKFMCSNLFYINSAKVIGEFFSFLVKEGLYNEKEGNKVQKMASHYRKEYPRIFKISKYLWDFVEHDSNELMALGDTPKYDARLKELQDEAKYYTVTEVGYVSITKVKGTQVFGVREDSGRKIGPVEVGIESAKLIKHGDIINIISVRKRKNSSYYEICELGYVYPKPYR